MHRAALLIWTALFPVALTAQLPTDLAQQLAEAQGTASKDSGRATLKHLSEVFVSDPSPAFDCVDVWQWRGVALQRQKSDDAAKNAEFWHSKALDFSRTLSAPELSLALSEELESQALDLLEDHTRAQELWANAVVLRARIMANSVLGSTSQSPGLSRPGRFSPPAVTVKVDPAYTEIARLLLKTGKVTLATVVAATGKVTQLHLVNGPGFGLDEQAAVAVLQWQFESGKKDNEPGNVRATIEVNFRLL
jgi:TonB family protein